MSKKDSIFVFFRIIVKKAILIFVPEKNKTKQKLYIKIQAREAADKVKCD